jgi:hypothetical protein
MNTDASPDERDSGGSRRTLIEEVERYLEAVEVFRALGCEPTWTRENGPNGPVVTLIAPFVEHVSSV